MNAFLRFSLRRAGRAGLAVVVAGGALALAGAARAAIPASAPGFGPPLAAVITTEHRYTDADGVSHVDTWREQLIRRPERLWTRRLGTAPNAARNTDAHGHDHAMPSPVRAATEITLVNGRPALHYADARHYTFIPPEEWTSTGFTADPMALAANVGANLLARLPVTRRPSPTRGARWHEGTVGGVAWRVLYDPVRRFAWRLEARGLGGRDTTLVRATPAPMAAPWQDYARLEQRDYSDLLD